MLGVGLFGGAVDQLLCGVRRRKAGSILSLRTGQSLWCGRHAEDAGRDPLIKRCGALQSRHGFFDDGQFQRCGFELAGDVA